jgi:DNA-directed RNA polymerase subunit RPC12/RpoP
VTVLKHKRFFVINVIIGVVSLGLTIIGAYFGLVAISNISLICLCIAIFVLMIGSSSNYKWICDKCGEGFEISFFQDIFSVYGEENYKRLRCPKCQRKNWCKGVPK